MATHAHIPLSPALRERLAPFTERVHAGTGQDPDPNEANDVATLGKRLEALEQLFQIEWCDSCGGYVDATTPDNTTQKATSAAFPTPPDL